MVSGCRNFIPQVSARLQAASTVVADFIIAMTSSSLICSNFRPEHRTAIGQCIHNNGLTLVFVQGTG